MPKRIPSFRSSPPNRTSIVLRDIALLVRDLPDRLQTLRIRCQSTSRKLSCSYEERHKQIFPAGFDVTSSSSSPQRPCYSFSPERLYDDLTSGYNPDHHVENIVVKSASYCKQTTGPKHEFIILEVEDTKSLGLRNFIVLDRNNSEPPNRSTPFYSSIQSSQSFVAKDEFRVSYDGNKRKLLEECGLKEHETLETLEFKSDEPLLLYQLATLTRAVSLQRDKYHVITANCYWFAGLIWDCIVRMRPSAHRKTAQGHIRGAFLSWLPQNTNTAELEVTFEFVEKELLEIDKKFTIQKQRWTQNHDQQLKDELTSAMRRIQELEERINASSDPSRH